MGFTEDLILGELYQKRFLQLIEFDESEMAKGNFKPWDLRIIHKNEQIFFEVKADKAASRTGNLAIEFECSGRPSGVNVTSCDYWIHFVVGKNRYYMIPIMDLRQAIADKKFSKIVKGGDGYRAQMYLFNENVFEEFLEEIPESLRTGTW